MKNFTREQAINIMELVAEITTAVAGKTPQSEENVDKLVRTLFPTMCELVEKES